MENLEMAQEGLEHAHGHGHAPDPDAARDTRRAAILVAILAAIAVVAEMSGNDAQTEYLAAHIAASDSWAEYQAKSVRRAIFAEEAATLALAPDAAAPPVVAAIARARAEAARMTDEPGKSGMAQLARAARAEEQERAHARHLHTTLERAVRGLQIGIVLSSLFIVVRLRPLLWLATGLGAISALYAAAASVGFV